MGEKKAKTKTFRVDVSEGLAKDIDSLEKDLGLNHIDLLRLTVAWGDWRRIVYKITKEYPTEFGIFLDKKIGLYKYTKSPKTEAEKKLGDAFRFMLLTGGMDKEEQEEYISQLMSEGISASDIFQMTRTRRSKKKK